MRIVHLCNRMGNLADGIINVVVDLATWQADNGHDVAVFSLGGDYERLLHEHGVTTRRVDFSQRSPKNLLRTVNRLNVELAMFAPDIVHSHTMTPAVVAAMTRRRGARRVSTVHNEFQRGSRLMGLSDAVVCVSEGVEQKMVANLLCRGKTCVVHNGVVGSPRRPRDGWRRFDEARWTTEEASDAPRLEPRPLQLVAVGSVSKRKGSDILLSAFDRLASDDHLVRLRFVGNVDDPGIVAPYIDRPWFRRVEFSGVVSDPTEYLRAADVLIVASRQDPHPLALLEGRQAGLAIVGSRVDGIPEALDHGNSGLLFDSEDSDGLAELLRALLASPAERAKYGLAAESGLEHYTVSRMGSDYLRVYERLLDTAKPESTPSQPIPVL